MDTAPKNAAKYEISNAYCITIAVYHACALVELLDGSIQEILQKNCAAKSKNESYLMKLDMA